MSDLKDKLNLKRRYRNKRGGTTIGNDFIRPCLKEFKTWKRCTLNFTKSALKSWAGSFTHIVKDDVQIEILCDIGMVKNDNVLMKALESCATEEDKAKVLRRHSEEKVLLKAFGADASIDNQKGFTNKYGWDLLHYMIAKEKLIIKFAVNTNSDEYSNNIYHEKAGYFTFPDGSIVAHYGTFNESESAHKGNNDSVRVWPSWDTSVAEDHEITINDVDEDFAGNESVKVHELSKETLEKIKETAPDNFPNKKDYKKEDEVEEQENEKDFTESNPENEEQDALDSKIVHKLRGYQEDAIKSWAEKYNFKGILEHATGSGKTFTALNMIEKLYEKDNPFVVIGVPVIPLGEQWHHEIDKFFGKKDISYSIIECWSTRDNRDWATNGWTELIERNDNTSNGSKHLVIFIVCNASLKKFSKKLYTKKEFDIEQCLFIGDECHRYVAPTYLNYLPRSKYRLGLSATPIINPEEKKENEIKMEEYFGGVCHTFTLDQAIPKYLCNYYYYPKECYLTEDEFKKWEKLYLQSGWSDDEDEESDKGRIFGAMARILGSAEDKLRVLENILPTDPDSRAHTLFFCGDNKDNHEVRDIEKTARILTERGWTPTKITCEESQEQRRGILNNFVEGRTDGLLSIRVLDEGIDIPEIRTAYILASSSNRRQFIQRRGRVLRKLDGVPDKEAKIYDFVVMPPETNSNAAKKLIEKELNRVEQMSSKALNKDEADNFIKERARK